MAPLACPFAGDDWPNSVGPKTMARFCIDIEFSAACWLILKEFSRECGKQSITCRNKLPMQMSHEVLQCGVIGIGEVVHPFMKANVS